MERPRRSSTSETDRYERAWLLAEHAVWTFGLVSLVTWGALRIDGATGARHELERFADLQAARAGNVTADRCAGPEPLGPQAHQRLAKLAGGAGPAAAGRTARPRRSGSKWRCCRAPTTSRSIARSAISTDTALPGTDGNSGIAGHRDGFFRGLKDVGPGDAIEIETLQGEEVYRVERVWVVYPEDVTVLEATPTRSLTLVTCYPFYHVGPAPQRYIVRAVRAGGPAAAARSQP